MGAITGSARASLVTVATDVTVKETDYMTTSAATPTRAGRISSEPRARRRSGAVLLAGAAFVSFVVVPGGSAKLYWMPIILGISYLLAGAVAGKGSLFWAAGLIVSSWGLAVLLLLRGTWTTDFSGTAVTAIGVGLVLAALLPRVGVPVSLASLAVPVLLIGVFELLQAESSSLFSKGWLFGIILALRGLYDLRPGD
jgi:hypothetical protein